MKNLAVMGVTNSASVTQGSCQASLDAVLGMLKCLPYELPHVSTAVLRVDAAQKGAGRGSIWMMRRSEQLASLHADLYGSYVSAGLLSQPRVTYASQSPGQLTGLSDGSLQNSYGCLITGEQLL